jgi:hypothetical protein
VIAQGLILFCTDSQTCAEEDFLSTQKQAANFPNMEMPGFGGRGLGCRNKTNIPKARTYCMSMRASQGIPGTSWFGI